MRRNFLLPPDEERFTPCIINGRSVRWSPLMALSGGNRRHIEKEAWRTRRDIPLCVINASHCTFFSPVIELFSRFIVELEAISL